LTGPSGLRKVAAMRKYNRTLLLGAILSLALLAPACSKK
jgi:hypothetical protein